MKIVTNCCNFSPIVQTTLPVINVIQLKLV